MDQTNNLCLTFLKHFHDEVLELCCCVLNVCYFFPSSFSLSSFVFPEQQIEIPKQTENEKCSILATRLLSSFPFLGFFGKTFHSTCTQIIAPLIHYSFHKHLITLSLFSATKKPNFLRISKLLILKWNFHTNSRKHFANCLSFSSLQKFILPMHLVTSTKTTFI